MRSFIRCLAIFCLAVAGARADILSLSNGDRFLGTVELVNASEVHIKSEVLGVVKVPRAKVVSIYFGTNQPPVFSASVEKEVIPGLNLDAKAIEKVQGDFLATAGPEANAMFKELVQGLSSGKVSVDDIREQARASLKELRELQAEIGEEADNPILESYVGILENFINKGAKKAPPAAPKEKSPADEE